METDSLERAVAAARERYAGAVEADARLDMSRGKPSPEQLSLANGLLDCVTGDDTASENGTDCRNYGGDLFGLPEARRLFAGMLEVSDDSIIVQDNSSLRLMFDTVAQCLLVGTTHGGPWSNSESVKFLCPVPGYDRHFGLLEYFGIDMIPVSMTDDGPDMDEVERLVRDDASVRGMFCVPRHSNPTGATYSADTVEALARMVTRGSGLSHLLGQRLRRSSPETVAASAALATRVLRAGGQRRSGDHVRLDLEDLTGRRRGIADRDEQEQSRLAACSSDETVDWSRQAQSAPPREIFS